MKIAYILYDDLTSLDFVGFYDPVSRLKSMNYISELSWDICGMGAEVQDHFGLRFRVDEIQPDLSRYDVVFIPGGFGTRTLIEDENFIRWLKTIRPDALKSSVCTGSLLLGAAGFLEGKQATTHFDEYEVLSRYCGRVIKDQIVEDGKVITAGAVASALELGLYMCNKWAGAEATTAIQQRMHYGL